MCRGEVRESQPDKLIAARSAARLRTRQSRLPLESGASAGVQLEGVDRRPVTRCKFTFQHFIALLIMSRPRITIKFEDGRYEACLVDVKSCPPPVDISDSVRDRC